jgi:DNA replication factor GINS
MNLDELQSVRDRERQTDKLQQLRESFYADAGQFIQQLRSERERAAERAEDPFDAPEVSQLSDEIDTAEQTVEAIYEKRVGKIVKAASFAAADLPAQVDGMTAEEQALFDTLVEDIRSNRERVLDVLAGEDDQSESGAGTPAPASREGLGAGTSTPASREASTADPDVSAADVMGGSSTGSDPSSASSIADGPSPSESRESRESSGEHQLPPTDAGQPPSESGEPAPEPPVRNDGGTDTASAEGDESSASIERETVRVTEDVDTFVGFDDRDYDLGRNDVVTLPATNAKLLVEQDAAEHLE